MKRYEVRKVDVTVKANRGDVISNDNIIEICMVQNESEDYRELHYFDTLEEAKAFFDKVSEANVRVDQTMIKNKFEIRCIFWTYEEVEYDEDDEPCQWFGEIEISPFMVEVK